MFVMIFVLTFFYVFAGFLLTNRLFTDTDIKRYLHMDLVSYTTHEINLWEEAYGTFDADVNVPIYCNDCF